MAIINKDLTKDDLASEKFSDVATSWTPKALEYKNEICYGSYGDTLGISIVIAYLKSINITEIKEAVDFFTDIAYPEFETITCHSTAYWFKSKVESIKPDTIYNILYKCSDTLFIKYLVYKIVYDLKLTDLRL